MRMEFPDNVKTNVYAIDGINEVFWDFYVGAEGDNEKIQDGNDGDEDLESEESLLSSFEIELQQKDKYVKLDVNPDGIWVFSLSEPDRAEALQISKRYELKLSSNGSVHAAELGRLLNYNSSISNMHNATSQPHMHGGHFRHANMEAFELNTFRTMIPSTSNVGTSPVNPDHITLSSNTLKIYSNFTKAVAHTLSASLANRSDWLRLSRRLCVNVRSLDGNFFDGLWPSAHAKTTTAASFDVQWSAKGTLSARHNLVAITRLRRVSNKPSAGDTDGLTVGAPLILSPSGIIVRYRGFERLTAKGPKKVASNLETRVMAHLSKRKLPVQENAEWIRVALIDDDSGTVPLTTTIWPAHLCFYEEPAPSIGDQRYLSNGMADEGLSDPLTKVESWYNGRLARAKLLEAKRQEGRLEEQKSRNHRVSDDDDDDAMSEALSPPEQYINTQDLSGIYPTPPDALGSQAPESSQNQDDNPTTSHYDRSADIEAFVKTMNPPYEAPEHDDLFGDMDIDLFASNALTEADFSFFDEPSENAQNVDQIMGDGTFVERIGDTMQASPLNIHQANDEQTSIEQVTDPEPSLDPNVNIPFGSKEETAGTSSLQIATNLVRMPAKLLKDEVYEMSGRKTINATVGNEDKSQDGLRTSYDIVQTQKLGLDKKYATEGRFGFNDSDLPSSKGLHEQKFLSKGMLPEIATYEGNLSAITEETDPDESSDEERSVLSSNGDLRRGSISSSLQMIHGDEGETGVDFAHPATPFSPDVAEARASDSETPGSMPPQAFFTPTTDCEILCFGNVHLETAKLPETNLVGNDERFIKVAQIVADQTIHGSLDFLAQNSKNALFDDPQYAQCHDSLSSVINRLLPQGKRCGLKDYAALFSFAPAEQQAPQQKQKVSFQLATGHLRAGPKIAKLQAPYISVRRTGVMTDVSASALPFWEELSLGPSYDSKNVIAYCVYPVKFCPQDAITAFSRMVKNVYQACNLGSHDLGRYVNELPPAVVPVHTSSKLSNDVLHEIETTCQTLGSRLATMRSQGGNTLVYLINPFDTPDALPCLCGSFLKLLEAYKSKSKERGVGNPNDLVLQVVPLRFIFSPERLSMPSLVDYKRLAFEVYNRCAPVEVLDQGTYTPYLSAPAICLAHAIPKSIDFKLTPDASSALLQSDGCIHVAYTWSSSEQWLSSSWTDNRGVLQWNASYLLGKGDQDPERPLGQVFNEILETTMEILRPQNRSWRLLLVKDGPVSVDEMRAWLPLFTDLRKSTNSCSLITVDSHPRLEFPKCDTADCNFDDPAVLLSTPVSTPFASGNSPDVTALSSTPGGGAQAGTPTATPAFADQDAEARLIDKTDETWTIITDGSSEDPLMTPRTCVAQACGFLVKRGGARDEDGLLPLEIKILNTQKPYKAFLKEVLEMYRNLAMLARVRGITDNRRGVLPLHVAAARKAHAAVSMGMPYRSP